MKILATLILVLICSLSALAADRTAEQADVAALLSKAEAGDSYAQAELGARYYKGVEGIPDFTASAKWFRKAADQGNATAQYNLSVQYFNGYGVERDYAEAYFWLMAFASKAVDDPGALDGKLAQYESLLAPAQVAAVKKRLLGLGIGAPRLSFASAAALAAPDKAVLYSLDPGKDGRKHQDTGGFHGWPVLGQAALVQGNAQAAARLFEQSIPPQEKQWRKADAAAESPSKCFIPRHGLSVSSGEHSYDFVLCYECGELRVYQDGELADSVAAQGSPKALNAMLKAAHIKLPPQPNP